MAAEYDIAVIGLGPAGANFARLVSAKYRVIALDKSDAGEGFYKPCGGLLAPDAQKQFSQLNLSLPKSVLVDPQIFSVRTVDLNAGLVRHYQRFYINMDRRKFDDWMRSLIPPEVEVLSGANCTAVTETADGYEIRAVTDEGERVIRARYVVAADGANSLVRRSFYPRSKIRRYLAVQQRFADVHAAPMYCCLFDKHITDCYAWGLSKDGEFIFGGAFKPANARADLERLKQKAAAYGFNLGAPLKTEACLVLRPKGMNNFCHGGGGIFLIGEAAGFISPSSLEGISYALQSSFRLAEVLERGEKRLGRRYRRATRGIRLRLFLKNLKSVFMYFPPFRKIIMRSGLNSISVQERGDF